VTAKIAIGVLTWRGYDATRACLESLRILGGWPIPTLIVDNDSGTGEGARLAAEFGAPIEALTLHENGGVPAGYNAAITWAANRGADFVLLLNNDTLITDPAMLKRLIEAIGNDVAVVGPIVRDPDGSLFSAGGFFSMRKGIGDHRKTPVMTDRPYASDWLDGPCLLVSLDAARRIGGLAPEYFLYWEELDWCVRARRAGYRCLVQPATAIVHGRTTREPSPHVRYLMLRNGILFMRRNGTAGENLTSFAWTVAARIPKLVAASVGRQGGIPVAVRVATRAIAWNMTDAIRRRRWRIPADGARID
jgi:GT2 family glycosyltransferase